MATGFASPNALRAALPSLLAIVALCAAAPSAHAQSSTALAPSQGPIELYLAAGERKLLSLDSAPGTITTATFTQIQDMLSVVRNSTDGTTHVPRTNDAGLHSTIRIEIIGATRAAASPENTLDVSCLHTHAPCSATVEVSAARTATLTDADRVAQEEILAEADDTRRHGEASTWPGALEKYKSVATQFNAANQSALRRAALNGQARLLMYRLGDYKSAHEAAIAAAAIDTGADDIQGQGLAYKTLSSVEYFLGDYNAAIAAAQKAIALYTQTGDTYWQGILLGNLAYTYREIGDTDNALRCSTEALAIARKIRDDFGIAFNLEAAATVHRTRGELEQAFELYYEALDAIHTQPYPSVEGAIYSGLGDLYTELNDDTRAEDAYQKALPLARSTRDAAGELKIIGSLGELYAREHRPQDALKILRGGLDQAETLGLAREQSELIAAIARNESELRDFTHARTDFAIAIDTAKKIGNRDAEAAALMDYGDFQAQQREPAPARESYARASTLWLAESNRALAATALASLARLDFTAGDNAKAHQEISDALAYFETSRASIASQDLRTSFFSSKHSYYDLAIEILMRLHRDSPNHGYDAEAFAVAERASSRALLDALSSAAVPNFLHAPPDLVAKQRENQSSLDALYERLRTLADNPAKNAAEIAGVRAQIEEQLRNGDTLDARIRAASGGYAALTGATPATPQQIAADLDSHSALVKYWAGDSHIFAWVVDATGLHTTTIADGSIGIELTTTHWLNAIQERAVITAGESLADRTERLARADADEKKDAGALGTLLLGPLDHPHGIDRIYLVADGPLASIPFGALRIVSTSHERANKSDRVISRFEIITEPSIAIQRQLAASRPSTEPPQQIAVFADAVYTANDPRVVNAHTKTNLPAPESADTTETLRLATEAGMANLPRLKKSREEASAIAALNGAANTQTYLGFDAVAQNVTHAEDWSQFAAVHFGVHALMNPEKPAFSGVVLSMVRADGTPQNGVLWLSNIYSLRMPVSLVVLSGCHTASGRNVAGEGLEGLSRAFFFAGARTVVGSLWSVEDHETSLLMQRFYRNLIQAKMSPAAALRRAQIETAGDPATSAPFHWAGFTVQGDGGAPLKFATGLATQHAPQQ
jgi:CHAT domain-containing protein/tetratricopeptide (TPR) repeat protein